MLFLVAATNPTEETNMAKKLSERAELVLGFIHERTRRNDDGTLTRFMVPQRDPAYDDIYGEHQRDGFRLSGSDGGIIKSLARKGFVEMMPLADYACATTEQGAVEYERIADGRRAAVRHLRDDARGIADRRPAGR